MSRALALLSGKGGSGKTTLALSIASMLSECCLKVLLIDCDLSTNGATYFYEGKLNEKQKEVDSFYKIFIASRPETTELVKINEYMDFMPSIVKITKTNAEAYHYNEQDLEKVKYIDKELRNRYDIIIYDCQAGYTDVLRLILPFTDSNLVVMEADAISSAAIRSFYLKTGELLNEKKIYQIFNKATDEEYKIYSKISGGTVFTNIETVMFDWKIRKAFSIAQIPDMERTSARYGEQIYNICKIIFDEDKIQEKLALYATIIELNKNKEEEKKLRTKIEQQSAKNKNRRYRLMRIVSALTGSILIILTTVLFIEIVNYSRIIDMKTSFMLIISLSILIGVISMVLMDDLFKEKRKGAKEMSYASRKLDEILSEQEALTEKLKEINENNKEIEE